MTDGTENLSFMMYALSSTVKILCQKDFMSETVRVDTVLNCAQSLTILGFTSFPIFSPRTKKLLYIFLIGSELTDYIVSKEFCKDLALQMFEQRTDIDYLLPLVSYSMKIY